MNAVVIGATKGLGLCLVRLLLEQGHRVAAGALMVSKELEELKQAHPETLLPVQVDVTDEKAMEAFAGQAKEFLGEIDSLCNVAGVLLDQDRTLLLHQCDIAELRKTLDVNTVGPVIAAKTFLPVLKKGAAVFTVTSEGVGVGSIGTWVPCYGLSKTAATKVCGILNASCKDADFYAVHPGRMNTDMGRTTAQIEPEESAQGFVKLMTGQIPLSRSQWYIDYIGNRMDC